MFPSHQAFSLPTFLLWFLLSGFPVSARKFTINNNCKFSIWPALFQTPVGGSAPSYTDATGWEAPAQSSKSVEIPEGWIGRFWARQQCDASGSCATGGCPGGINCTSTGTPPVTLLEFSLAATLPIDFYDISIVDGFNLPVELKSSTACPTIDCPSDFNPWCPSDARAVVGSDGSTLACKNEEKYWDQLAKGCPHAYVRPTDDANAQFSNQQCPGANGADYTITFCPFDTVVFTDGGNTTPNSTTTTGTTTGTTSNTNTATTSNTGTSTSQTTPTQGTTGTTTGTAPTGGPTGDHSSSTGGDGSPTGVPTRQNALSSGAIAGISIGAALVLLLIALIIFFCLRRRKQKQDLLNAEPLTYDPVHPFRDFPNYNITTTTMTSNGSLGVVQAVPTEKRIRNRSGDNQTMSEKPPYPPPPIHQSSSSQSSGTITTSRARSRSQSHSNTSPSPRSPVNIQQLFEDRRFEGELLNFLSSRMDPPSSTGGRRMDDDAPPTYRAPPSGDI